jgi:uncharacterized membrane protein (DUF2068 family)
VLTSVASFYRTGQPFSEPNVPTFQRLNVPAPLVLPGLELYLARPYRLLGVWPMHTSKKIVALRTVAVFEAAKGLIVLLLGLGLLRLVHKNLDEFAEHLVHTLHASPEGRLSNLFVAAANQATDKSLWALAAAAVVYAIVRFAEAYGLWLDREWAEWFALLSGSMYLPWEVYSILRHPLPVKWVVLAVNLAIVLYMLVLRVQAGAHRSAARGAS